MCVGGRGGRDHEHTVICCSQPYTRPSCALRVEPVGIQFIIHQICFVAASEKKTQISNISTFVTLNPPDVYSVQLRIQLMDVRR